MKSSDPLLCDAHFQGINNSQERLVNSVYISNEGTGGKEEITLYFWVGLLCTLLCELIQHVAMNEKKL